MTPRMDTATRVAKLCLAIALGVWGVGDRPTQAIGAPPAGVKTGITEPSIYALDLPLVDQHGRTLKLADLRGRPLVATMVYTTCTSVCPSVTAEMKVVERQLAASVRADVTFAMFSLDPGRDTPEALLRFADVHGLDDSRWRLFATSDENVRVLSAVLGVKYTPEDNGDIAHSALILVIDRDGVVRHRQVGLGGHPEALIAALGRIGR